MSLTLTILGCGSSGGVPRLADTPGGNWGACDPANPKNRRRRCAALLTRETAQGRTRVLIDTGPDFRDQMLSHGIGTLDAVVFTHAHADHTHGLDDIRMLTFNMRKRMPVWADADTSNALIDRFGYAFVTPAGSNYPPICDLNLINTDVTIDGAGGPITLTPIPVQHGDIDALGFRIGSAAYIPDVSAIPDSSWPLITGLDTLVIDALRYSPHPSHANVEQALAWISSAAPQNAVLTNMHIDIDHDTILHDTPDHVRPAYDGMTLEIQDHAPASSV